jgi:hypothetical protein
MPGSRQTLNLLPFLLIQWMVLPAPASIASPSVHACTDSTVVVQAQDPVDYRAVCQGAGAAVSFFADLGMLPTHPIVVEIVPRLPDVVSETAVGCYLEEGQRILVLEYPQFQQSETWFGIPVDRSMYQSLVAHEVAHAVGNCNFALPDPPIQAKEYIAYVVMFATMNPGLRKRILHANPGKGFDSELKINTTIYLCDPMRFGVEAYRHYLKKQHGAAFLLDVLSGKALAYRRDG